MSLQTHTYVYLYLLRSALHHSNLKERSHISREVVMIECPSTSRDAQMWKEHFCNNQRTTQVPEISSEAAEMV